MPAIPGESRVEAAVRAAGIGLAALVIPFVLLAVVGRVLLGVVFPGWTRRSDAARRQVRAQIHEWQVQQLAPYRAKTYAELAALAPRTLLSGPPHLQGCRFTLERSRGDAGGIQVAVRASQRVVWPLFASDSESFEILENGQLVEQPPYEDSNDEL